MKPSSCKSCGAPIYWAKTSAGKDIPLDAKPQKGFIVDFVKSSETLKAIPRNVYISHFATCPNADFHRK